MNNEVSPFTRTTLLEYFLTLHTRYGVEAIAPIIETDTSRPGVAVEAADAPYVRLTWRDGLHAFHLHILTSYANNALAKFMDDAAPYFAPLARDWEVAQRPAEPEVLQPWRVRFTHEEGTVDVPYLLAASPLEAWNLVLARNGSLKVGAAINGLTPPPACLPFWRYALVYTDQGELASSRPYLFEAEPVRLQD